MTRPEQISVLHYIDSQLRPVTSALGRLSEQLDRHEEYHRDLLGDELATVRNARFQTWATVLSCLTTLGTLLALVVTIRGHG